MNNLGKETLFGKVIFEIEQYAVVVRDEELNEKERELSIFLLPKVNGELFSPLGFILGHNSLSIKYLK